jgi:hypothetical protein
VARHLGEKLPVIAFGTFKLLDTYQDELEVQTGSREVPVRPGCFALSEPYHGMVLILHDNCPARYINDAKGRPNKSKNVQFYQHPDPRSLAYDSEQGLQLFLQLEATRDIEAGEELCCAYGHNFWSKMASNVKTLVEQPEAWKTLKAEAEQDEIEEEQEQQQEQKRQEEAGRQLLLDDQKDNNSEEPKKQNKQNPKKPREQSSEEKYQIEQINIDSESTDDDNLALKRSGSTQEKTPTSSTNKRFAFSRFSCDLLRTYVC